MINTPRLYTTDAENNSYINSSVEYIIVPTNKSRLKITDDSETKMIDIRILWVANWQKHTNVNQNTKSVNNEKTRLLGLFKNNSREVYGNIPNNLLTTDDREALRLFERKAASPILVADFRPLMVEEEISHLLIKLRFINTKTPSSRKMPKGNKIFLETYIGLAGIADADLVFSNGVVIGNAFYTFLFDAEDAGKTCYFRAYYQNTRGDRSPVSLILSIVIA